MTVKTTTTITCDNCKSEITDGYFIIKRGILDAYLNDYHNHSYVFCGYSCLIEWAKRTEIEEQALREGAVIVYDENNHPTIVKLEKEDEQNSHS